jgi:hypothetical protein
MRLHAHQRYGIGRRGGEVLHVEMGLRAARRAVAVQQERLWMDDEIRQPRLLPRLAGRGRVE